MKHSTPILSAVRAMHAHEDATGRDPYNQLPRAVRRAYVDPVNPVTTPAQREEAAQLLSCYETELEVLP